MKNLLQSIFVAFAFSHLLSAPSWAQTQPINERWIGTWQRSDKPLVITNTHFDGCVWGARRGKDCNANYSGTVKKSDLMKVQFSEEYKALLSRLSDDSFRKIEKGHRGNSMEREYASYMIYDQGFIYEIGWTTTEGNYILQYTRIK